MSQKAQKTSQISQTHAEKAISEGDWKTAAEYYAKFGEQRASELALINSVQEGLSSKLDMQGIYDLVGDKLRDTFNAQVVMISQYDLNSKKIFHRYAIERGRHLHIEGWQPLDSSRAEVIRTRKPFMINLEEINRVLEAGMMSVVPGTESPKTWLGVPLLVGNVAVGIVSLQNLDKENAFTKSDIDLLMTLTNSMSLSLENARLFNESQHFLKLLEGEVKLARRTQRSILPLRTPRRHGYDFGSIIVPARGIAGDFYDFIYLDKDRLSIVIGDVSDKGLPAALFMALTFSLLRAETEQSDDPHKILYNVNRYLLKMNASGMFVTILYGILDCRTGSFKYSRAGHLPPVVLDVDGKEIKVKKDIGQPLGLFSEVRLDDQEVIIQRGGLALLYSDGLNEATDMQGNEFGIERIKEVMFIHRGESAKVICNKLWGEVRFHSDIVPYQDDLVTVIVKRQV